MGRFIHIFFSCKGCVSYYLKSTEKINDLGYFLITEHICQVLGDAALVSRAIKPISIEKKLDPDDPRGLSG